MGSLVTLSYLVKLICSGRNIAEIRAAIPERLFVRHTSRGLAFLARDVLLAAVVWKLGLRIDPHFHTYKVSYHSWAPILEVLRWFAWGL